MAAAPGATSSATARDGLVFESLLWRKRGDPMARQQFDGKSALAFMLGLAAGVLVRDSATRAYRRARVAQAHSEYERTATFDQNLPDQLGRREPLPQQDQPRYGGTGALGVSPIAAATPGTSD